MLSKRTFVSCAMRSLDGIILSHRLFGRSAILVKTASPSVMCMNTFWCMQKILFVLRKSETLSLWRKNRQKYIRIPIMTLVVVGDPFLWQRKQVMPLLISSMRLLRPEEKYIPLLQVDVGLCQKRRLRSYLLMVAFISARIITASRTRFVICLKSPVWLRGHGGQVTRWAILILPKRKSWRFLARTIFLIHLSQKLYYRELSILQLIPAILFLTPSLAPAQLLPLPTKWVDATLELKWVTMPIHIARYAWIK